MYIPSSELRLPSLSREARASRPSLECRVFLAAGSSRASSTWDGHSRCTRWNTCNTDILQPLQHTHTEQGRNQTHLIDGIVCPHDTYDRHRARREVDHLPRPGTRPRHFITDTSQRADTGIRLCTNCSTTCRRPWSGRRPCPSASS